jgi:7,8-dihydropterin-6-yl-methyl-4-(beta-D-ribofuranosyl)aminobenzene 5'-phosphate synthase
MGSVALSRGPVDLPDVPVFVPAPLKTPTTRSIVVREPRCIATGVITTGPIASQDFMFGWTLEQSLAFYVEGRGIVIVIGCGHPRVERIIERVEMLVDAPIYGVVGGLHYPVTASRWVVGRLPMQQIFGTGKWPWDPIGPRDVKKGIAAIGSRRRW